MTTTQDFDINTATVQEACDYAVQKVVAQGGQCMSPWNPEFCAYDDGKGKHCAVEWLLDHSNSRLMQVAGTITMLVNEYKPHIPELLSEHLEIFAALQRYHDVKKIEEFHEAQARLENQGIDMSGPHWQQWAELRGFA